MFKKTKEIQKVVGVEPKNIAPIESNEENNSLIRPAFLPDTGFSTSSVLGNTFYDRGHDQETFYSIFNGMMNYETNYYARSNSSAFTDEIIDASIVLESRREMLRHVFENRVQFLLSNALSNYINMCNSISIAIIRELNENNGDSDDTNALLAASEIMKIGQDLYQQNRYFHIHNFTLRSILNGDFVGKVTGDIAGHAFMDISTKLTSAIYSSWYSNYFSALKTVGIEDKFIGAYTDAAIILRDTFNYLLNYLYNEACTVYRDASFPSINPPKDNKRNRYLDDDDDWM